MASQKAITGNAQKNNGGTFLNATTTRNNIITATHNFTKWAFSGRRGNNIKINVYGAKLISDFAFNRFSNYSIAVAYYNKFWGDTVSNLGIYPQFVQTRSYARPIHRKEAFKTLRRRTAGWNWATGAFLTNPTLATDTMESIDNSSVIDSATYPTRAVPGKFAYQYGAASVKRTTYRAKTGG